MEPRVAKIVKLMNALDRRPAGATMAQRRETAAALARRGAFLVMPKGPEPAEQRDITVPVDGGRIIVRLYIPHGGRRSPLHVFLHGGGWCVGTLDERDARCRAISSGANCVVANATIAAGAVIHPFTHIDGEKAGVAVGEGALVGPFARLRPGAQLGAEVHIGNFVEVKNSTLAAGAKANHLAYLGDATVGERVNYGAGSITANYDGANKHRTVIEADVHVGSNCVLVAPVTIGAGGTVGGGSTITKSTPPGALSVARGKQVSIPNWPRPAKLPKT